MSPYSDAHPIFGVHPKLEFSFILYMMAMSEGLAYADTFLFTDSRIPRLSCSKQSHSRFFSTHFQKSVHL